MRNIYSGFSIYFAVAGGVETFSVILLRLSKFFAAGTIKVFLAYSQLRSPRQFTKTSIRMVSRVALPATTL